MDHYYALRGNLNLHIGRKQLKLLRAHLDIPGGIECNSGTDLFTWLEGKLLIKREDVGYLRKLFLLCDLSSLIGIVEEYEKTLPTIKQSKPVSKQEILAIKPVNPLVHFLMVREEVIQLLGKGQVLEKVIESWGKINTNLPIPDDIISLAGTKPKLAATGLVLWVEQESLVGPFLKVFILHCPKGQIDFENIKEFH